MTIHVLLLQLGCGYLSSHALVWLLSPPTGVAINEAASVELPGIQGIWSLRQHFTSAFDKVLCSSLQRVHAI